MISFGALCVSDQREGLGDYTIGGRQPSVTSASMLVETEGPYECQRDAMDRMAKQFVHHITYKHPRWVALHSPM